MAVLVVCNLMNTAHAQLDIDPGLEISRTQTNNFFNQRTNGTSAAGLVVSPTLTVNAVTERLRSSVRLAATYANFDQEGSEDNYLDSTLSSDLSYRLGSRHLISLNSAINRNHDPFGTERTQGGVFNNAELDKYVTGSGGLRYLFGAQNALLNFELAGSGSEKTYTTNRFATRVLDHQTLGGSFTTYINISPKTALLAETGVSSTRFDFLTGPADLRDGNETYHRAGIRWRAAAKTTGDLRFGISEREIENTGQQVFRRAAWAAAITWEATQAATISVRSNRATSESFLANVPVLFNRSYSLNWAQNWTRKFSSTLNTSVIESEFLAINRTDTLYSNGLTLVYQTDRIFGIAGTATHTVRDSDVLANNFDNLSVSLGVRISL